MDNMTPEKYDYGYNLGRLDGRTALRHGVQDHGRLLSAIDPYAIGYRDGISEGREKMKEKLTAYLAELNASEDHEKAVARDYNGNTGDYRVSSHDGADYLYISDFYGIAMDGVWAVAELTDAQCADLVAGRNAERL